MPEFLSRLTFWGNCAAVFLSGSLAVVLSYLLGRRLLNRLLRLITRTRTVYIAAGETIATYGAGDLRAWIETIFHANGVPLRGLDILPAGGGASVLIRARVRVDNPFRAQNTLARIQQGMLGIAGMQDFYVEV